MKSLKHENILELKDVLYNEQKLIMALEYMQYDLDWYLNRLQPPRALSEVACKLIMYQALKGVASCHANDIMHRDLKPTNLLMGRDGTLKVADFGLARTLLLNGQSLSSHVITQWYRAPEVILCDPNYGSAVDIWSLGCILGELLMRHPMFPGGCLRDQITQIFALLGTPDESTWPGMTQLPAFKGAIPKFQALDMRAVFRVGDGYGVQLMSLMLRLCPERRISAVTALRHFWFYETFPKHAVYWPDDDGLAQLVTLIRTPPDSFTSDSAPAKMSDQDMFERFPSVDSRPWTHYSNPDIPRWGERGRRYTRRHSLVLGFSGLTALSMSR